MTNRPLFQPYRAVIAFQLQRGTPASERHRPTARHCWHRRHRPRPVVQTHGVCNGHERSVTLLHTFFVAGRMGLALVAVQSLFFTGAFRILAASVTVESLAPQLLEIRIWAAPATLIYMPWPAGWSGSNAVAASLHCSFKRPEIRVGHLIRPWPVLGHCRRRRQSPDC